MNGYLAEANVPSVNDVATWLQEAIAHFYPASTYANGLSAEVKARAARQIFSPPMTGARVTCPHCGAPNPNHGRMEDIIFFVCSRCGSSVEVEPPKVQ
jgi:DNA-directed RNA polymerase subunit RPC12/RpoP